MRKMIPKFYMHNCKDALDYYHTVLGGEIKNLQLSDDNKMFAGYEGKVTHAELHINENCILYFSDIFKEEKTTSRNSIMLEFNSKEELEKVYNQMKLDSHVLLELNKTFWGSYHSDLIDRFGNEWELNYDEH